MMETIGEKRVGLERSERFTIYAAHAKEQAEQCRLLAGQYIYEAQVAEEATGNVIAGQALRQEAGNLIKMAEAHEDSATQYLNRL